MAPSFIKAFTVHLNRERRHELKKKTFMASSTILSEARFLYTISSSVPMCDLIEDQMERLATTFTDEFIRRCRTISKTTRERQYVAAVVNKHIVPTINLSFTRHIERINKLDILNIINNVTDVPRFFLTCRVDRFKTKMEVFNSKIKTQITI
jgi:hypothetical protein